MNRSASTGKTYSRKTLLRTGRNRVMLLLARFRIKYITNTYDRQKVSLKADCFLLWHVTGRKKYATKT